MDREGAVPCQLVSVPEYGPDQTSSTRKCVAQGTEVPELGARGGKEWADKNEQQEKLLKRKQDSFSQQQ